MSRYFTWQFSVEGVRGADMDTGERDTIYIVHDSKPSMDLHAHLLISIGFHIHRMDEII